MKIHYAPGAVMDLFLLDPQSVIYSMPPREVSLIHKLAILHKSMLEFRYHARQLVGRTRSRRITELDQKNEAPERARAVELGESN